MSAVQLSTALLGSGRLVPTPPRAGLPSGWKVRDLVELAALAGAV
jgi:hypothetical protein